MLSLDALIAGLPLRLERGSRDVTVGDLVEDSRRVTPGACFLARPGAAADGRDFIAEALARGATSVITDRAPFADVPAEVAWARAERADTPLAAGLAERFFDHPSRALTLVGVTGTNGKTTTATLIHHLLNAGGTRAGLIGTLGTTLPAPATNGRAHADETLDTGLTTPGPIEVSRALAQMRERGCEAAVMEVSSHALEQGRAGALAFDVGVFTNLTGDHLDYHGTMDAYAEAKAELFALLGADGWCVVNDDDPYAGRMIERFTGRGGRVLRCAVREARTDEAEKEGDASPECCARILALAADGSRARFEGPWGAFEATLPLVGRYNLANALAALAAAHAITQHGTAHLRALEECPPVPGRLERVPSVRFPVSDSSMQAEQDGAPDGREMDLPAVLVDYAHTHDALENVLLALRPLVRGRLHVVFGCGGDRDREKRPKMAAIAARFADELWITSDNPRTERPQRIIDDMIEGLPTEPGAGASNGRSPLPAAAAVHVEPDRAEAIAGAIRAAAPGDTVLIAGKGHEDYQVLADRTIHFDDREQAATALRLWHKERSAPWPRTG